MNLTCRVPATAIALAAAVLLSACSANPDPQPTETEPAGAGSGGESSIVDEGAPAASSGDGSALDRATADGLPELGLVECPTSTEYEYSPEGYRTVWHIVYACTNRDAFDATTANLVGAGYFLDPLVISSGSNVSERNYLQADANGGSTEVQLNLVGGPEELEFEIYVTLTLP